MIFRREENWKRLQICCLDSVTNFKGDTMNVLVVPIGEGKWEIGYHVAKAYTCMGYATEAVKAFLPLMAKRVGIEEVYGIRLLENVSSGRVLEKCGFETFFEGEGEYHNGVYEISKSVWKA